MKMMRAEKLLIWFSIIVVLVFLGLFLYDNIARPTPQIFPFRLF
jgi:hypothetical protein